MRAVFLAVLLAAGCVGASRGKPSGTPAATGPAPRCPERTPECATEHGRMLWTIRALVQRSGKLVGVAHARKDAGKWQCIRDKHRELTALLRIAETAYTDLRSARAQSDGDAAAHHDQYIRLSHERALMVRDEAEACIGVARYQGNVSVTVDEL